MSLPLALMMIASSCSLMNRGDTADTLIPKIPVEKHTLANGLEVLLVEDHRLPQVSVDIWYHVGPVNEEKGRTGFAHLFEHMMFQKSKHTPEDSFFRFLEAAGASGVNGTTAFDRTNYYETVPSNQLELALWLESDRMGYLLDDLTEASFRNQQDVVRNERRENFRESTLRSRRRSDVAPVVSQRPSLLRGSYRLARRHSGSAIEGCEEFLQAVLRSQQRESCYRRRHQQDRDAGTRRKVFRHLEERPRRPSSQGHHATDHGRAPGLSSRIVSSCRVFTWRGLVRRSTPTRMPVADIASDILGGDKVSRLYKSLVYEKRIAQDVAAYNISYTLGSVFTIQATAAPNHTLEEIEKEIDAQLETLRQTPPSESELNGTKRSFERNALVFAGIQRWRRRHSGSNQLPTTIFGRIRIFSRRTSSGIAKQHRESIKEFAAKYLTKNSRVVVYGMPGEPDFGPNVPSGAKSTSREGGESVNADEAWRATPPKPGPDPRLAFPSLESFQLSNGLTVILDSRKGLPVVAASLDIRGGLAANPPDKPGLSAFMLDMLDEGTTTRSALDFAEQLKQAGVQIGTVPGRDYSGVVLTATRGTLAAGFDLLADAVLNPAFDEKELDRVRQLRLGELVQVKSDPSSGVGHPYDPGA